MDSGNSSSMQSSSCGGEEEYDSRADHSISAFFNHHHRSSAAPRTPPVHHHLIDVGGGDLIIDPSPPSQPPPPPLLHQTHLDPLMANYFAGNNNINLDMVWSSKPGRRPSLAGLDHTSEACHPPPPPPQQPFFSNPHHQQHQLIIRPPNSTTGSGQIGGDLKNNNNNNTGNNSNNNNHMVRNSKKRSRASRRAPTTVLTTDTTNFRAMVQEFTGIPAPPFTGSLSSPFHRNNRFDLFGSSSSSFPLKPFAQKLIAPTSSFLSPSSAIASNSSSSSLGMGYCLPSAESQNLLNTNTQSITNPILNIQSPRNPLSDLSILTSKSKVLFDPSDQNVKMAGNNGVEEFGHVGTNFGGLQSIVSSSSTSTLVQRNENSEVENGGVNLLRTIGGNFGESIHRATNYRATTRPAVAAVAPENSIAAARNEGMVESWICSSD